MKRKRGQTGKASYKGSRSEHMLEVQEVNEPDIGEPEIEEWKK